MMNFTGTGRTDYEEVLRSIGYFIDQNNFKEICILELKEGFLLRGLSFTAERSGFQTISESYLFTDEDIERIVEEAYQRRGAGGARGGAAGGGPQTGPMTQTGPIHQTGPMPQGGPQGGQQGGPPQGGPPQQGGPQGSPQGGGPQGGFPQGGGSPQGGAPGA